MAEKVKEKKKHKGLKVLGVIILIIALIVGIGFGVIYYLTKLLTTQATRQLMSAVC